MSTDTGVLDALDAPPVPVPGIEHKSGAAPGGILEVHDETGVVEALVSVTGVEDEVKDIIVPGAYGPTLRKRKPKGVFSHDWGRWVARTEVVEEWMPGDPRLPTKSRLGDNWPTAAGALYVRMRFNLKSREGRDAYENVKFFSETGECEWSIGYHVPDGKSSKDRRGVRHIKELDLFEYSPVLFGAAPLSGTLAVKSRLAALGAADDTATALLVADLMAIQAKSEDDLTPDLDPDVLAAAFAEVGVESWMADPDEAKNLGDDHTWRVHARVLVEDERDYLDLQAKFDPTGSASTRRPLGHGDNWVTRSGGLPMLIRRVAHHLIDKGRPESVAIATAVNWAKKMCSTGRAFGGKVKVSKSAQAAACSAVAEWERKKGEAHTKALLDGLRSPAPNPAGNRDDLVRAVESYDWARPREQAQVKGWLVKQARTLEALDALPSGWDSDGDGLVAEWTPDAEVGEYASKSLGGACAPPEEAKAYPYLEGSFEEIQDALRAALNERFLGDPLPSDGEDSAYGPSRREWSYVEVVGTYHDHVTFRRAAYNGPNSGKTETFEVAYSRNTDGSVDFGDPKPAAIEVTARVIGGEDDFEDDDYGFDAEVDGDGDPSPQFVVLGALKAVEAVALGIDMAAQYALDTKSGRVLSSANVAALKSAVTYLVEVLKRAGVDFDEGLGTKDADAAPAPATVPVPTPAPAPAGAVTVDDDGVARIDPAEVKARIESQRATASV